MTANLTPTGADLKLIEAVAKGAIADYGSADSIENDPNGHQRGEERTVSASIIYALSAGTNSDWPIHPDAIRIVGGRIKDDLDLSRVEIHFPLAFVGCYIERRILDCSTMVRAPVLPLASPILTRLVQPTSS
jgi:hypothetical protein